MLLRACATIGVGAQVARAKQRLEADFAGKFYAAVARCAATGCVDLSKVGVVDVAAGIAVLRGVGKAEGFRAKLKQYPLRYGEGAEDGGVEVKEAGAGEGVLAGVAIGRGGGCAED